jgi:mannose-6-phosphate isomerase-like protein (cupin superfamily)
MSDVKKYIESGILELFVLGLASANEIAEVEEMALKHPEVAEEIREINNSLRQYSKKDGRTGNSTIKPMVMAIIDYQERLMAGEHPTNPPLLSEQSSPSDFQEWLKRPDMFLPEDSNEIYAKLIGANERATTAIVWVKTETPFEIHDHEYERFLILEGTCDIVIDDKPHSLVPGDYMSIPLHSGHFVKVTSDIPCKVILQRVAA